MCTKLLISVSSPSQLIEKNVHVSSAVYSYSLVMAQLQPGKSDRWWRVGALPFLGFRRTEKENWEKTAGEIVKVDGKDIRVGVPIKAFAEKHNGTLKWVNFDKTTKVVFQLRLVPGRGMGWVALTKEGTHNFGDNRALVPL